MTQGDLTVNQSSKKRTHLSIRPALAVFWESSQDWYNGMIGLATMNLIWLVAGLTVVLLPPATAGLYVVTNSVGHGTGGRIEDLFSGARKYALVSFLWALANIAVAIVFSVGFRFYGALGSTLGVIIQAGFAATGILWLAMQFYVWPFLIEQEDKRLHVALKNALFLTLANPIYTSLMLSIVGIVLLVSVFTMVPLALFTISFISLLGNRAVIERLTTYNNALDDESSSGDGDISGDLES